MSAISAVMLAAVLGASVVCVVSLGWCLGFMGLSRGRGFGGEKKVRAGIGVVRAASMKFVHDAISDDAKIEILLRNFWNSLRATLFASPISLSARR